MNETYEPDRYELRAAGVDDAAMIARHRVEMFRDMGILDRREEAALRITSLSYLEQALRRGDYLGWVIEHGGQVVAGGGLYIRFLAPRPGCPEVSEEAYVLNVYIEPAHRRRGLARRLMQHILAWCAERGVSRVSLHASDAGRPLYEQLGMVATNEMRLECRFGDRP